MTQKRMIFTNFDTHIPKLFLTAFGKLFKLFKASCCKTGISNFAKGPLLQGELDMVSSGCHKKTTKEPKEIIVKNLGI